MFPLADVYRNCPFRVLWNGRHVAGFPEASPLPQNLKSKNARESGGPPPALGPEGQRTPFYINLERGIAFDHGFEQWVSMVRCYGPATGKGSLLVEYKRPLTLEVYDENGTFFCAYHLAQCWVDEYQAIPDPDPESHVVAIEHMRLGFASWERVPPEDVGED